MRQFYFPALLTVLFVCFSPCWLYAQNAGGTLTGTIYSNGYPLENVHVYLQNGKWGSNSDAQGNYRILNIPEGIYTLIVSAIGYGEQEREIRIYPGKITAENFILTESSDGLEEVVISGTMKEVTKLQSPVPVEIYSPKFFKANPTPSIYEALQNVNGVRPQINCAVCNTGDIHINGLEGPYTMVLIDGMPIVSGLSTVYGLNGIPQSLIERVEIVKGPASSLYGSEAVGGLINVITKKTTNAPLFATDVFGNSWGELNADASTKLRVGKKAEMLLGVNYFNYSNRIDHDGDNFTDVTLQDRISIFNKWNFIRKDQRVFTLAGRYVYEDRFGGDLRWTPRHRGGTEIYGESIYTGRWELFGTYQLPTTERLMLQFSANEHQQNSVYGDTWYIAQQKIGFTQLTWDKELGRHDLLSGLSMRYTYYDDNTPATATADNLHPENLPTHTFLPGIFLQDEIKLDDQNVLLLGMRYDYNSLHGSIYTPRLNYKWTSPHKKDIWRLSLGTGYRVANVFTEDHAALTGAREVVLLQGLHPETSYNGNINYVKKWFGARDFFLTMDASLFYTYFTNKIFPDYDTDPAKIIYGNLAGYAVSRGISANFDLEYRNFKAITGFTLMDVFSVQNGERERQELTEQFTATWSLGYTFPGLKLTLDYTGNIYSPMALPTQSTADFTDPRPAFSPWYSIQNVQLTRTFGKAWECYGGIKNLLNWTPWKNLNGIPYLGNTADPFGTHTSPASLAFDPAYVYGPNQGIRAFLGLRYTFN